MKGDTYLARMSYNVSVSTPGTQRRVILTRRVVITKGRF
jgi:hypothetical protein